MIVTQSRKVAKLFCFVTITGLIIYIALAFFSLHKAYLVNYSTVTLSHKKGYLEDKGRRNEHSLKFILIETKNSESFTITEGQKILRNQCPQIMCYLTTNETRLKSKRLFDAVVVNVTELSKTTVTSSRPKEQLYIFYGMEPSETMPVCNPKVDNFFNYTWSYKLDSDIVSPFFVIRDFNGSVVAPNINAKWSMGIEKSTLGKEMIKTFEKKNKAVAMVVRSCSDNEGKIFANRLKEALKTHGQEMHIFGCGNKRPLMGSGAAIAKEYYYVFVTTGGASRDYVTDKVSNIYWNNAVPIIRANADLSKFLPPGSYLNAHAQTPEQIAASVHYSIRNPSVYRNFFKWRNFYTFHKRMELEGICELCSLLHNGNSAFSNSSANLRKWWESKCL